MSRGGQALDLNGSRFGRLVARRRVALIPKKGYEWECDCDCGSTVVVLAASLRSGVKRSCGCLFREVIRAPRPYARKRPYEYLYNRLVSQARARGVSCTLTLEQFVAFTARGSCHYCGEEIRWETVSVRGARINLDRMDNQRGYEAGNVVECCWECNDGKGERYTYAEWSAMAAALREVRSNG